MKNDKQNEKQTQYGMSENSAQSGTKPKRRRNRVGRIAYVTIVHALGVGAIVGLSVALFFSQDKLDMQAKYQRDMESVYSRSYYNLLDGANDIDVTMSKLSAASSPEKQQALLYELWSASTLAEENLTAFEGEDEGVKTATKFVNQLGDYSLYLARKLSEGESLSSSDRETLSKLKPMTVVLKDALQTVQTEVNSGKLFLENDGILTTFSSAFSEFTEPSLDYPEMIYDGPFSDALETKEAKALAGESEISSEVGTANVAKLFPDAVDVKYVGRCEGRIPTYNYSMTINGAPAYLQLSVKGGKVINFNVAANSASGAELVGAGEKAIAFAQRMGYENMEVVWSATANGVCFVNLAPVENGIILYPDLVKVKISSDGEVVGFDSSHHAYNHVPRVLPNPSISAEDAKSRITLSNVREGRLTLIPENETKETLCYEFECEQDGTYFVYIDALSGREREIFYVIESEQGTVLM